MYLNQLCDTLSPSRTLSRTLLFALAALALVWPQSALSADLVIRIPGDLSQQVQMLLKNLRPEFTNVCNKLYCLYFASLSSLV